LVEHFLAKEDVASSSLVARSNSLYLVKKLILKGIHSEKNREKRLKSASYLAEAIIRARAILAEGLIASEVYVPNESAPRRREIHDLVDLYLEEGQNRLKDSLRKVTADSRRYILKKFVADSAISTAGEITGSKINQWLIGLKREGKSKSTLWTYGERVRNFVKFLMPKYAPSTALNGFTMPDQPTNGRQG
jgi:hypothetical protein